MEQLDISKLVTKKEKFYFAIMLIFSIIIYLLSIISIIGIIYILIAGIALFISQGMFIGYIKQNAVKITPSQFGDIHEKIKEYSAKLGLERVPDTYLAQSGGLLNAFATRFLWSDVLVIYSSILELAYEQGEDAVNFVIAHELAHVKRKHMSKIPYIVLGWFIPFLGWAYSRACESTCDKISMALTGPVGKDGLLVLLAGQKLYKKVDYNLFLMNANSEKGFWSWYSEICSTHPNLSTRLKQLTEEI